MVEAFDMLGFLTLANAPRRTVAWRHGSAVGYLEFLTRVSAWRAVLRRCDGHAFALYSEDSVELAGALFGAWQAGKIVYLPGDNLPGTCAGLRPIVDGFLGEFAPEWSPLAPLSHEPAVDADDLRRLDGEFTGLVLFTSGTTGTPQTIAKKLAQMSREVATLEIQFGQLLGSAAIVATVSHQHIYGLLFRVLWPLVAGRTFHARTYPYF